MTLSPFIFKEFLTVERYGSIVGGQNDSDYVTSSSIETNFFFNNSYNDIAARI